MYRYCLSVILLFTLMSCKGQSASTANQYTDGIVVGNNIWGLTTTGSIKIFSLKDGSPVVKPFNNRSAIVAFTTDHAGNVIVADSSNTIQQIDPNTFKNKFIGKCDTTVVALINDSHNNCYALTNKGIADVVGHHTYFPNDFSQRHLRSSNGKLDRPSAYFIDKDDYIWAAFDYGEWGFDLMAFNTVTKQFKNLGYKKIAKGMSSPRSIFEGNDGIYMTTSLMHFMVLGSIVRINNFKDTVIFRTGEGSDLSDKHASFSNPEYIGAGAYNKYNNCLYFYSQNGIFKGNPKADLSKIGNWQKILQPKLMWTNGQRNAVGAQMNVSKLEFVDKEKFFFISQNDGIGLYDGNKLIMLQ